MKQRGRDLKTSCRIAVCTAASVNVLATAPSASHFSRFELAVAETLKGAGAPRMWMESERGVFFLDSRSRGIYTPHLRGQGILKLDDENVVRGSNLTLGEIRTRARALGQ